VSSLNSLLLLVIFLGCAAAISLSGIKLSHTTDCSSNACTSARRWAA
jgi:hypothetical protein